MNAFAPAARAKAPGLSAPGACAWLLMTVMLAFAAAAVAEDPGTRIGYVDMKRLIDSAPQLAAGRALLEREFAERDRALKTEQARLAELTRIRDREAGVATAEITAARGREIELLTRNLERTRVRLRDDLNRRAQDEYRKRWDEMHDEVVAFARANDYDLIVESPVVYANPAIDVTDEVLERLRRAPLAPAP